MSLHTVAATRSLIGDEATQISFEKFPHIGLSKTYCVNKQVADSACTATAYLCGVKGNYGTIGVNAKVERYNCEQGLDETNFTPSIAKWAQDAGKDTGLVTTARVTHASPAGLYAHTANRDWENDEKIRGNGCDSTKNTDIAQQLVDWETGKNMKVVLGGGRGEFLDASMKDGEGLAGWRGDGQNLVEKWLSNHKSMGNATYAWNRDELLAVDPEKTDYLLGLFNEGHCSFHGDLKREGRDKIEPTLTEMTEVAIKMLQKSENGFFLFVEGARIDMAHHDTKARKSLEDTEEFAKALQRARDMTSEEDTLIVVTSDHAHTLTINGYPVGFPYILSFFRLEGIRTSVNLLHDLELCYKRKYFDLIQMRGSNILGLSGDSGTDGIPYTSISYANGPGFDNTYKETGGGRRDITNDDFTDADYLYPATVPLDSETHGGDDVGIFASGPHSHLFDGNFEQNNIPYLMAYAAGIGPYEGRTDGAAEVTVTLSLLIGSVLVVLGYLYQFPYRGEEKKCDVFCCKLNFNVGTAYDCGYVFHLKCGK